VAGFKTWKKITSPKNVSGSHKKISSPKNGAGSQSLFSTALSNQPSVIQKKSGGDKFDVN
jgi:hypothetical protein